MSLFTHLECSIPCGAPALDPHGRHFLCPCGAPLLARYDLDKATAWSRETLRGRVPNMWRYRELMPLFDGEEPITLGEGFTPLVHARALGATIGLDRLYIKDESLNPTNSFKARGQAAAITRAKYIGATTIALPTAGNAGNAAAAYSAAARAGSTNCATHELRFLTLARYIASNSAGGKECVDGRFMIASVQALSRGYFSS